MPTNNPAGALEPVLADSIRRLDSWLEAHDWKAYDPFDGLYSAYASLLTLGGIPLLRIALQQLNRRSPLNLRGLLGIRPERSSKAMGYFARGYLALHAADRQQVHLERVRFCLDWLIANSSPGFHGYCWGNHFDYQSRGGCIPKGMPTVVWTGLIGHAFLDAFDALAEERYLDVARSACDFILLDLPRVPGTEGAACIGYTPQLGQVGIHNSNMIGASLLARVYRHTGREELLDLARRAVRYTAACQLENGGWFYGVGEKWAWIDSFHTGYVLEALHRYECYSGDTLFHDRLARGFRFFVQRFFEDSGLPRYYHHKRPPIDIQCASQGIETLVALSRLEPRSIDLASRVALWTIRHMQDADGHFHFRKYRLVSNRTPTLHWGQATMLAALALLALEAKRYSRTAVAEVRWQ